MSSDKDIPLRPINSGPQGDQDDPKPQDVDQLLGSLTVHVNGRSACSAVVRKVTEKIGDELVDRHIRILATGIKAYKDRKEQYAKSDHPTSCFYRKNDAGAFVKNDTWDEETVKRLTAYQVVIDTLQKAVNKCLLAEAMGADYAELETLLKECNVFI